MSFVRMAGDGQNKAVAGGKAVGKKFVNPMAEMVVAGGEEVLTVGAQQGKVLGKASVKAAAAGGAAAVAGVQETAKSEKSNAVRNFATARPSCTATAAGHARPISCSLA